MQKALTTEDLLYILNGIFKVSSANNNAVSYKENDGLFVEDYHRDLSEHTDNNDIHVTKRIRDILDDITIDVDTDDIYYRGILLSRVSQLPNNAIKQKDDGIFVNDFEQETKEHINDSSIHVDSNYTQAIDEHLADTDIHVTIQDQSNWNEHKDNDDIHITKQEKEKFHVHNDNVDIHVTKAQKDAWADHKDNSDIHVTTADKEYWNSIYENARQHSVNLINNLTFDDFQFVTSLPTEHMSSSTIYFLFNPKEDGETNAEDGIYIWTQEKWFHFSITKDTYDALKKALEDRLDALEKDSHTHANKEYLDKFSEDENGNLLYNNTDIRCMFISDNPNNALVMTDGKLYVRDYTELLNSLQVAAAFSKENLYSGECDAAGSYELKGHIDDYSVILLDYYFKNELGEVSNAKSVMLDVDTMNDLYDQGIDYMLELGYGISVSNSKIRMHDDQLIINYYHNVCIYKVTGIRKGDING